VKIMVGGAVTTADYPAKIGADGYAPDAMGAVRCAEELLANKA
jgi:5-methyltetrahydrofolate--homocysteine methyltransferase